MLSYGCTLNISLVIDLSILILQQWKQTIKHRIMTAALWSLDKYY